MGYVFNDDYSLDLLKNPVLAKKWENFKRRNKENDILDIKEIKTRGKNRVYKLLFTSIEMKKAAINYFGVDNLQEDDVTDIAKLIA